MEKYIRVTTFLNPERDAPLLAWLSAQKNKSEAIRDLMRVHIQNQEQGEASNASAVAVDAETVRQAVADALAGALDLATIRQVVEAGVVSGLAGRVVAASPAAEVADETDRLLDTLGDNLVVE